MSPIDRFILSNPKYIKKILLYDNEINNLYFNKNLDSISKKKNIFIFLKIIKRIDWIRKIKRVNF